MPARDFWNGQAKARPTNRKVINAIIIDMKENSRVSHMSRDGAQALNNQRLCNIDGWKREREDSQAIVARKATKWGSRLEITFTSPMANEATIQHCQPLIIELDISSFQVKGLLVNARSLRNVLFLAILTKMEIDTAELTPRYMDLVGFTGKSSISLGEITLPPQPWDHQAYHFPNRWKRVPAQRDHGTIMDQCHDSNTFDVSLVGTVSHGRWHGGDLRRSSKSRAIQEGKSELIFFLRAEIVSLSLKGSFNNWL